MPNPNSILLCDSLMIDSELALDGSFWYFDKPFVGSGFVGKRFVRVKPGERPPIPHESFKDVRGKPVLPGGVSVVEYRTPLCRYCRTPIPKDYEQGQRCLNCGGTELEVEQVESLFITVEPGFKPQARSL